MNKKSKIYKLSVFIILYIFLIILPNISANTNGNITASIDSWIGTGIPTINKGTTTSLYIGCDGLCGAPDTTYGSTRSLLNFSFSGINGTINNATLYLYNDGTYFSGPATWLASNISVYRITQTWKESTVTWNNQPTFNSTLLGSKVINSGSGSYTASWISFNLSSSVIQDMVNGNLNQWGFILKTEESVDNNGKIFYSKEGTNKPYMVIDYNNWTNPSINTIYPLNQTYNINVSTLNYTVSDIRVPDSCWYSNSSGIWNSSIVSAGTNFTNVISKEGSNIWTIYCNNSDGNLNSTSVIFTKDTINPLINITFPSNNSNFSYKNVNINYTRSDTNLGSCWYSNDTYVSNTTLSSCTNITTVNWTEGNHNVTIWINDSAGNINSSQVTFRVDMTPPVSTITMKSPPGGATYNNDTWTKNNVEITIIVTDSGVGYDNTNYPLYCTDTTNTCIPDTWIGSGVTVSTENVSYIRYYSNDTLNNKEITKSRTIKIDTISPNLIITNPTNNQNFSYNTSINLNFSLSDISSGIANCSYSLNSGTNISIPSCNNLTINVPEGSNNVTIFVNDSAGNINSSQVTFMVDTTNPLISYGTGTNSNYANLSQSSVYINTTWTETNFANITFTLANSSWSNSTTYTTAVYLINFTGIADGNYWYYVNITDNVNNKNSTTIYNITLDTTNPLISYGVNTVDNYANLSQSSVYINTTWTETNFANITFTLANSSWSNSTTYTTAVYLINFTGIADGNYWYYVNITDLLNHENSTNIYNISLDTRAPNATLLTPINNSYNTTDQNYTANVTDNLGIKNATLYIFNSTGSQVNLTTFTFASNTVQQVIGTVVTLTDGFYNWFYKIFDLSGNTYTTQNNTVTIDKTFPKISIITPTNNTNSTNANLNINYTISDANLNSCWYSNDTYLTNTTLTNCTNITNVIWSDGDHNVTIWANDYAGNINSTSVIFKIDSTPPSLSIVFPIDTRTYNIATLSLNYTVSDSGVGLSTCWYRNDTDLDNITITCGQNTTITNIDGTHKVYMWANDTLGNIVNTFNTYTISTSAPAISLIYPTNNSYLNNSNAIFNYTVDDLNGVNICELYGNFNGTYSVNKTNNHNGDFNVNSSEGNFTVNMDNGNYIWDIWCNNTANNGGFYTNNWTMTIDTINPLISYGTGVNQNNTNTTKNSIFLNVTVTELNPKNITFILWNQTSQVNSTTFSMTNQNSNNTINWTNLPDGIYIYNVTINDLANNKNSTNTFLTRIDKTPPSLILYSPVSNTQYSDNNSISLNLSVSDNLIGIKICQYYVLNLTDLSVIIPTTSIVNCENTTFSLPGGDIDYIIYLNAYDNLNNFNGTSVTFGIRTNSPAINIYPTNNTQVNHLTNNYFNFTITTNTAGISTCELWGNFNGTYSLNQTKTSGITSNGITKNPFNPLNLTEGSFQWNVGCNDSFNHIGWALNNLTFVTDITSPQVNITNLNGSSVGLTFNMTYNINDLHPNSCYYNLLKSGVWYSSPNQSISCSTTTKEITISAGTYDLYLWGSDIAGNLNQDVKTLTAASSTGPGSGGGTTIINQTVTIFSNKTSCGDGICQSWGNDAGLNESYYNCPTDCQGADIDSIFFGCLDNDSLTPCVWLSTTYQYVALFFGMLIMIVGVSTVEDKKSGKQVNTVKYYYLKATGKRKVK